MAVNLARQALAERLYLGKLNLSRAPPPPVFGFLKLQRLAVHKTQAMNRTELAIVFAVDF